MLPKPTRRAVIDVGHKCNLECTHCYHLHEMKSGKATYRPVEQLKNEIFLAQQRGNNYIDFTGGEPSLHPEIADLIQHCTSLNMKACIITNAITGSKQTQTILDAGVDDWLVSIHDDVMRLPGGTKFKAREKQERFLKQVQDFSKKKDDRPFRFNFCMTKQNQKKIVLAAKWAAKWKPRIFNFINFNPHQDWKSDSEGTKKVVGDLNVIEEQLCEAIPILLDAGCGVNVRYFPMCRLPDVFRQHVCNDLHVTTDPYEWDYDITPKTFTAYSKAAANMSKSVEWNARPCHGCDLQFICGGINSAFYRATDDKTCITAIKDSGVLRDDFYHYRRQNTLCLTDRNPVCDAERVVAVADDSNYAFIPVFIRQMMIERPDSDVLLVCNHTHHDEARAMVNMSSGYGIYDMVIKNVSSEAMEIKGNPSGKLFLEKLIEVSDMVNEDTDHYFEITDSKIIPGNSNVTQVYRQCGLLDSRIENKVSELFPAKVVQKNQQVKPAGKNKRSFKSYPGNLLIYTICNQAYQWYIPLFARSLGISYPDQHAVIEVVGGVDKEVLDMVKNNKNVTVVDYAEGRESASEDVVDKLSEKYAVATLRFLSEPPAMANYTHFLITDIDIMFMPENKSIIDIHMHHLEKDGTVCYENFISEYQGGSPRMPGVMFVTSDWFAKTASTRKSEYEKLIQNGATEYCYDEMLIGRLVTDSGLPLTPIAHKDKLWRHHGIHIGDWRICIDRKARFIPQNVFQKMHICTLLKDELFMAFTLRCAEHIPMISKITKRWPMILK